MSGVAVILLNWNSYDLLRACLHSLRNATYPDLRTYVVDNGSRDASEVDRLMEEFPKVTVMRLPENVGFARACNVGIKRALAEGAAHVILLNNDTVVEPGFAEPLVAAAESDPRIGAVTGKIYYAADRRRIWCAGGDHHWLLGNCEYTGEGMVDRGQFDRMREIGFATMCYSLFPRRVFEAVGLVPEQYFFGLEEWDYSVALRKAGYQLVYVPDSVIYHKVGQSYGRFEAGMIYNFYRNKILFTRSYMPRWFWWAWYVVFAAYAVGLAPFRMRLLAYDRGEGERRGDRTFHRVSVSVMRRVIAKALADARSKSVVTWKDIQAVREEFCLPALGMR